MTLDEAINNWEEQVIKYEKRRLQDNFISSREYNSRCATECSQLVDWLQELKVRRDADVPPVIETENMATISDEFICRRCGIYIKDCFKVVMDEDNDGFVDKLPYNYEPKYCPECGAKVKED